MSKRRQAVDSDRVTVTLAPHQRVALLRIAEENETTLAYVVRCAVKQFIQNSDNSQLQLSSPARAANRGTTNVR